MAQVPLYQKRVILMKRPTSKVVPGEHLVVEQDAKVPRMTDLEDDDVLIRILWISLDPAMRGWMNDKKSYIPPVQLGAVMRANAIGEVLATKSRAYKAGDLVQGSFGMQEFAVAKVKDVARCLVPPPFPISTALGMFGLTGLTAYFGLLSVGKPVRGETVVVSAAAGATGSVVAQIAKHVIGCRVVGIAGGSKKCSWIKQELGVDEAVDYRSPTFMRDLARAVPKGVDVFFDNVGGTVLNEVLRYINQGARVVICGAIAGYNAAAPPPGPSNYLSLLVNRARMEGFIVFDYRKRYGEAQADLFRWAKEGKLKYTEDVVEGLENAPVALLKLFDGRNTGKLVVKVADLAPQLTHAKL
eukprot:GGOE01013665.1.p1 GENE.GGOE01013665.1~~GGOE01013665.1.p1  ORF type:complete len:370 (-),score=65.65 GGOE01013665.1:350-1417(-)